MSKESNKFEREWLLNKPEAIINYVSTSFSLARKIIASKEKMVENFNESMKGSKFEDNLRKYVDNTLLSDAYRDGMNSKLSFTESEKHRYALFVEYQRIEIKSAVDLLYRNYLSGNYFFAYPSYTNLPKRYKMECITGLNATSLKLWTQNKGYVEIPLSWDDYMIKNFAWIPAFDL